ncbi:hypothetical protein BU26DRAFT_561123 [Trematosphaeria pertusa]|uniref:Heterokaryon incompatibility domain-containing protein n=1 Tax=Trematosphaeria pertusa TaxID=390896 RepID=A0A6A6ITK6_9PLEO|nr:uncharacterized protein BU26DRAFT_561123 [Trematosphaeria pertusa]KAF2253855.1 hypothetical protein BU26DRAFT_561123 [Trematosphaeria pertusa]
MTCGARATQAACVAASAELFGDEALIRTFRLQPQASSAETDGFSKKISNLSQHIVTFDRHKQCQTQFNYIAISHVWDPTISDAHVQGPTTPFKTKARNHIFEALERLITGIGGIIDEDTEIWYDYISVPQWENDLKVRILGAIPDIFYDADFTLVDLDDVTDDAISLLRHGKTTEDRIAGVTGVCNAKWFKRVWTVMEYVRSRNVKGMNQEGRIFDEVVLLGEVLGVWEEERRKVGSVQELEALAQMGKNIVPWNLGRLTEGRALKRLDFGNAFNLLSRRGCRSSRDFFHALLGIVKADLKEPLKDDPVQAMLQIATSCMEAGDYSPLLMVPRSEIEYTSNAPDLFHKCGYTDVLAFGLGIQTGFPTFHSESSFGTDKSHLKLEQIGLVTYASTYTLGHAPIYSFLQIARTVLSHTGPDLEQFVTTIGARLYNFHDDDVADVLSDKEKTGRLQGILTQWYNKTQCCLFEQMRLDTVQAVADLLGVTAILPKTHDVVSPLGFIYEHGGTLHNGNPGSIIAARCPGCHETFFYRAGLYGSPANVRGSVAYRIAGLRHDGAREDGLGILVKDGVITGRLIWASRACECRHPEMVDVSLRNLPMRMPRDDP